MVLIWFLYGPYTGKNTRPFKVKLYAIIAHLKTQRYIFCGTMNFESNDQNPCKIINFLSPFF